MFSTTKPTQNPDTRAGYERRYLQIQRRLTKETQSEEPLGPDELVANLIQLKPGYAMRTWRSYKAAVLYYIETYHPEYETAIEHLRQESSKGLRPRGINTSGGKQKAVPKRTWEKLVRVLEARGAEGHRHSKGLLAVLRATLLTGLRPNEWFQSEVSEHEETGRDVLRVMNSKYSNGRANGEARELFIDGLNAAERDIIEAALAYCSVPNDAEAEKTQTALRNELATAIRWGIEHKMMRRQDEFKGISQYSFRHQFIADAKLVFDDPVVIAALVGHNSTKTAFEHYGRRRHGRNPIRVLPTPETVEAVQKQRLEIYTDFVANRGHGAYLS